MSNGNSIFKAFITGMALGAGTALLLAPRTGEETREKLRELGEQASEMTEGGSNIARRIRDLRGEIQDLTETAVSGGSDRVQNELESLRRAFEEGRKVLREERQRRLDRDPDDESLDMADEDDE